MKNVCMREWRCECVHCVHYVHLINVSLTVFFVRYGFILILRSECEIHTVNSTNFIISFSNTLVEIIFGIPHLNFQT